MKDKLQSQKVENSSSNGGLRVRHMKITTRTNSCNDKIIPTSEVKSAKNATILQGANKSTSAFNFVNSVKKDMQKQSPLKQVRGDKIFADDKSSATLKTESTNISAGTASKGSSEKSQDESPDASQFSSVFLSP